MPLLWLTRTSFPVQIAIMLVPSGPIAIARAPCWEGIPCWRCSCSRRRREPGGYAGEEHCQSKKQSCVSHVQSQSILVICLGFAGSCRVPFHDDPPRGSEFCEPYGRPSQIGCGRINSRRLDCVRSLVDALSTWNEKALRRACPPSLTGVTLATNFGGARLGASGSFSTWAAALRRV